MATIQAIAHKVGVSTETVSRVLNRGALSSRSDAVRRAEHIRAVARQLGYRSNAAAKAISTGRFGSVALVQSTHWGRSTLPGFLINGVSRALARDDLSLLLTQLPDEELVSKGYLPKFMRQNMCDGLLINYTDHIPAPLFARLREGSVPCIWLNTKLPHDCVYPDDAQGAAMLTQTLIKAGHRAIAYADCSHGLDQKSPHYSALDRENGYRQAMDDAGLNPRVVRPATTLEGHARADFSEQWLARSPRPTAVVCNSSGTAIPLALAAARLGLRVPADLLIASHDNVAETIAGTPFPTAVVPQEQMGRTAVEMLLRKLENPEVSLPAKALAFPLNAGHLVGPRN